MNSVEPTTPSPQPVPTAVIPSPLTPTEPVKPRREGLRSIISIILLLVSAPLIAILLTAFVFQSYEVEGQSMQQTLLNHDRLIVWKVPRSLAKVTGHSYVPRRGDIIVFGRHNVFEGGPTGERQLIKRVIGLPGERVVVHDQKLTVYNDEHPGGFNPDPLFAQALVTYPTTGDTDIKVKTDELFVSGDNRPNSSDSRSFGAISVTDIVGKLLIRVLPIDSAKLF